MQEIIKEVYLKEGWVHSFIFRGSRELDSQCWKVRDCNYAEIFKEAHTWADNIIALAEKYEDIK